MAAHTDVHCQVQCNQVCLQGVSEALAKLRTDCFCSGINYEIVIVDDNSQDNTQGVVRQLQELYGDERIVSTCSKHSMATVHRAHA